MAGEERTIEGAKRTQEPQTSRPQKKKPAGKAGTGRKKLSKKALLARKKRLRKKKIRRIAGRCALSLATLLVVVVAGVYALLSVIFLGPSQTAGDLLTISLLETSALKFVPSLYYGQAEIDAIKDRNKVIEPEGTTDLTLVTIRKPEQEPDADASENTNEQKEEEDIYVEEITGATYHGWIMVVKDPSRVSVGVSRDYFTNDARGMLIADMAEKYGAVGAINGGAFADSGGVGNGGMPSGLTISDGVIRKSSGGADLTTAGFTEDDILVVGKFTKAKATEMKIRDACSFGPALVVNGEPVEFSGASSGLNPRTAIGQRADGAVLMLVIDGRQVNSMGASYADLVNIMVRYGAVNACNLDGGSSSNMYYNGEILNDGVAITGSRHIPTTFIVR